MFVKFECVCVCSRLNGFVRLSGLRCVFLLCLRDVGWLRVLCVFPLCLYVFVRVVYMRYCVLFVLV